MSSFSLTSSGFTFTNANQETKSIVIDDATNTIKFQQFNISTPSVTTVEYVDPNNNNQGGGGQGGGQGGGGGGG